LLAYTAHAGLNAEGLQRVLLSTDDSAIADAGQSLGLEVPFRRPFELAQDDTPMVEVLAHLLDWLESEKECCDGLVLLQPTSPLRTSEHIEAAMVLFEQHISATVVSVMAVPHQYTPTSLMCEFGGMLQPWLPGEQVLRRQDKQKLWARNGPAILIANPTDIRQGRLYGDRVIGYEMDACSSLDVDSPDDLARAERALREKDPGE
jgi:CMP-N-acetylneuraminic acid synthetase